MTYPDVWRPVPADIDLPASVYETRAAVDGVDWAEATLATVDAGAAPSPAFTFFPDVSEFQTPVDDTFRSQILSFRICDGTYFDTNAAANWRKASQLLADPSHPLQLIWVYFFYRPGTWGAVEAYIRRVFGADTFPDRVAAMIDCEGWGGQITGNHSPELNDWAQGLATKTKSGPASIVGYSYTSAFNEIWPQILPWIKRQTASYGGWNPGWYGWQYSGGTGTGGLPGWAHGAAPWPLCDMNVIQRPIGQILADFGFATTEDDVLDPNDPTVQKILAALDTDVTHPGKVCLGDVWRMANANNNDLNHGYTNASIRKALDLLAQAVPTADEIAQAIVDLGGSGTGGALTKQDVVDAVTGLNLLTKQDLLDALNSTHLQSG